MNMLLGSALAATLLPISLVFSRALAMVFVVGVVGLLSTVSLGSPTRGLAKPPGVQQKTSLMKLSSWTAKSWRDLAVSRCSLHDVSHRKDSVDVAMTDD